MTSKHDATSKAKLSAEWPRAAAEAGLLPRAWQLMAIIVGESWPTERGWVMKHGLRELADKYAISFRTLRRSAEELAAAGMIRRLELPGCDAEVLITVLTEATSGTSQNQVGPPVARGCGHQWPGGVATSGPTSKVVSKAVSSKTSTTTSTLAPALTPEPEQPETAVAAAGRDDGRSGGVEIQDKPVSAGFEPPEPKMPCTHPPDELIEAIARPPSWIGDRPWIDRATAYRIARELPQLTTGIVAYAVRQAGAKRNTLANPAGYLIRELRDPEFRSIAIDDERRRREARQRAAEAAERAAERPDRHGGQYDTDEAREAKHAAYERWRARMRIGAA